MRRRWDALPAEGSRWLGLGRWKAWATRDRVRTQASASRHAWAARSTFIEALAASVVAGALGLAAGSAVAARAEHQGTLDILIEDHATLARVRHVLVTASERLELRFDGAAKAPASWRRGQTLRVRGDRQGTADALALTSSDVATATLAADAVVTARTTGEFKTLVLLVNFSDDRSQPFTAATARAVALDQMGAFVRENSHGQSWLTGDVRGWLELPIARTCNGATIATAANQAASASGSDPATFDRVVYAFPENTACGWGGMANLGGSAPAVWINGWMTLQNVAHEFGHTLGLRHAHALDCGTTSTGPSGCTAWEYGDKLDVMGNTVAAHIGAFGKQRLGWLDAPGQPPITTAAASGRYALEAYALAPTGAPKALRVPRSPDPLTGARRWYYVEYRQYFGFDTVLAANTASNVAGGVVLRSATEGDGNSSEWLDASPNSSTWDDWADAALAFGQAFTDAESGVQIVALDGTGTSARVDVTLGGGAPGCTRAPPTIALQNPSTTSVTAGTALTYRATISNLDSAGCAAATMQLATTAPSGWTSALNATQVALAPQTSTAVTWSLASPAAAPAGTQTATLRATSGASALAATVTASYTVLGTSATALLSETLATDKPSYRRGETVIATAVVRRGTTGGAGASVVFTFRRPDGTTVQRTATSDAAGIARASYRIARKDALGAWRVDGAATLDGQTAANSFAFGVQ